MFKTKRTRKGGEEWGGGGSLERIILSEIGSLFAAMDQEAPQQCRGITDPTQPDPIVHISGFNLMKLRLRRISQIKNQHHVFHFHAGWNRLGSATLGGKERLCALGVLFITIMCFCFQHRRLDSSPFTPRMFFLLVSLRTSLTNRHGVRPAAPQTTHCTHNTSPPPGSLCYFISRFNLVSLVIEAEFSTAT